MRIQLLIERARVEDASIILETHGFVADDAAPEEIPKEGAVAVTGEFPEKHLPELQAIEGIRDWRILPLEEEKPTGSWPWSQQPETD